MVDIVERQVSEKRDTEQLDVQFVGARVATWLGEPLEGPRNQPRAQVAPPIELGR